MCTLFALLSQLFADDRFHEVTKQLLHTFYIKYPIHSQSPLSHFMRQLSIKPQTPAAH